MEKKENKNRGMGLGILHLIISNGNSTPRERKEEFTIFESKDSRQSKFGRRYSFSINMSTCIVQSWRLRE
jgi:hypothetical protein